MNIVKIGIKVNFKGRATSACKRFNGNRCNNVHTPTKFLTIEFYTLALLVILAMLVAVFIGIVLLQLFVYSLLLIKSADKDPESGLRSSAKTRIRLVAYGWRGSAVGLCG